MGVLSARRRAWVLVTCAAALAAGALASGFLLFGRGGSGDDIAGLRSFGNLRRDHVEGPVTYRQVPPPGGPHSATWAPCQYYDGAVPMEAAVHSLEHGAVWITYRPDAGDGSLLRSLGASGYVLVSALPLQRVPVVASAWGHQLALPSTRDRRLAAFLVRYRQGPDAPELGGSCSGPTAG